MRNPYTLLFALLPAVLFSALLAAQAPATITTCITHKGKPLALPVSLLFFTSNSMYTLSSIQTNPEGCSVFEAPDVPGGIDTAFALPIFDGDNTLNGVSTWDNELIYRHALGLEPLDLFRQYFSADVNRSKSVTTFDIIELRKFILGLTPEFSTPPNVWQFFPERFTNFHFGPFNFPILYWDTLIPPFDTIRFEAAKRGDVSGNALDVPGSAPHEALPQGADLCLGIEPKTLSAGETAWVSLRAMNGIYTLGYQFDIAIKPPLYIEDVELVPPPNEHTFAIVGDRLSVSRNFFLVPEYLAPGSVLMQMKIGATGPANLDTGFVLLHNRIAPEAYEKTDAERYRRLKLACAPTSLDEAETGSFRVRFSPNPVYGRTRLYFEAPLSDVSGPVNWSVFDLNGQTVLQGREPGIDTSGIELDTERLVPGLYGYRVHIGNSIAVGKLVRL